VNSWRIAITMFVFALLAIVTLGLIWTSTHQAPPLRTASQVVLSIAALSGIYAVVKIWRAEPPRIRTSRS
jgi:hypothetical protein